MGRGRKRRLGWRLVGRGLGRGGRRLVGGRLRRRRGRLGLVRRDGLLVGDMRRVVTADGLATGRVEGLVLLAGDLVRIGAAQAFELQVL